MDQSNEEHSAADASTRFAIHDLVAVRLEPYKLPSGEHLAALRFGDHLLRRFGLAEVVTVDPENSPRLHLRAEADEVWALIEGQVEFLWHDLRPGSPTHDRWDRLHCAEPTSVLVPFGVAFGARGLGAPARLLRLASHDQVEMADETWLDWPDQRA